MSIVTRDTFTGSNNIAKPERLPEGAVVDALNMDFTVGGKAELRTGFTKVLSGSNIRGVFPLPNSAVAVVIGNDIVKFRSGVSEAIATVSPGPIAAVLHNDVLHLNTLAEAIIIGGPSPSWYISSPPFDISVKQGSLPAGIYKFAVTAVEGGRESGCFPVCIRVAEGQSVVITSSGGVNYRLYSSVADGETLYYQGMASSYNEISSPVDDTERLSTAMLTRMPFCYNLTSHGSMIVGSYGPFLYHTEPMMPHLHDPESGFVQFPSEVTIIASVRDGTFVCADKTYFITDLGGPDIAQRVVADYGAIAGTHVSLPNGSASWFCKYGQVIAAPDGSIELINGGSYSPDTAQYGASGLLEHNGNQMIITTMRGEQNDSNLKSTDFWDLQVN